MKSVKAPRKEPRTDKNGILKISQEEFLKVILINLPKIF